MRRPPPESVRLTSGARNLAAPTSYSFVTDRPEGNGQPKRPERPTLPGAASPSSPKGWSADKAPASMAEAIARVSPKRRATAADEPTQVKSPAPVTRKQPGAPTKSEPDAPTLPIIERKAAQPPTGEAGDKKEPAEPPPSKPLSRPRYGPPVPTTQPSPKPPGVKPLARGAAPSRPTYASADKPEPPTDRSSSTGTGAAPAASKTDDELSWEPAPPSKTDVPPSVFGLRKSSPPGPPPSVTGIEREATVRMDISPKPEEAAAGEVPKLEVSEVDIEGLLDGLDDSVDALLDDIDAGFDRIVESPGSARDVALSEGEAKEVQELFTQIAAGHMRPVRDFMIELGLGEPPREWIDLVTPAVSSLGKSAEGMGLSELRAATDVFLDALRGVAESREPRITAEQRKDLTEAFELLAGELPGAFDLTEERDRREPIIVQSLLRQVPDVRKVALDKLYAAGLTSLEMYYAAQPYDVSQAAGLSEELAARIVKRFVQYRRETSVGTPDLERTHEHKKLAVLVARLSQQNDAFESASKAWSKNAVRDKKRLRKERNETVLELNVLLARLGEVDLVSRMEKLAFQAKIDALRAYMDEVKERAAVESGQQT
jgi:DNA repair protein RadA